MTVVWVYAVTGADGATWSGAPAGVDEAPVRAVAEGDVAALVSDVAAAEYEQPELDRRVADPAWLEPRATAHQDVNAAAHAALRSSLPVPFATIYRADDGVRDMLRARSAELGAKLNALERRAEWVVALYRDTVEAAEHLARVREAMAPRETVAAGAGRRYLEARKGEGERRSELGRLDEEAAAAARQAVGRVSKTAFEEPIVEGSGDVVARTTYVLRRGDEPRFDDALSRFNSDWRERGYELRATGPWPPYRSSREVV